MSNFLFQYYSAGGRRYINLIGTDPLSKFDTSLFWVDKEQNLFTLYLPPFGNATIKLIFIKKNALAVN